MAVENELIELSIEWGGAHTLDMFSIDVCTYTCIYVACTYEPYLPVLKVERFSTLKHALWIYMYTITAVSRKSAHPPLFGRLVRCSAHRHSFARLR